MQYVTCECQFNEGGRSYTYLTKRRYFPGQKVWAEVGADDIKQVTVLECHTTDRRDPNAKFEYRRILGTTQELRDWMKSTNDTEIIFNTFDRVCNGDFQQLATAPSAGE